MTSKSQVTNDLFITTLHELHCEAPIELLKSLRAQLGQIKLTNPNCAQTAEACLNGLASDRSSLLHVLTAAYLINGGVMIKHQAVNEEDKPEYTRRSLTMQESKKLLGQELDRKSESLDLGNEFDSLEEELNNFSITINGDLKTKTCSISAQPPPVRPPGSAREPLEHF